MRSESLFVVISAAGRSVSAFGQFARVGLDGDWLREYLAFNTKLDGIVAGLQAKCSAAWARWGSIGSGRWGSGWMAGIDWRRREAARAHAEASWRNNIQSDAMHALLR
jgi:hypothetical protein